MPKNLKHREILIEKAREDLGKDNSFEQINFVTELTPYAVEIRYDEFTPIIKDDLAKLVSQTEEALNFILMKIAL
jgi:hypothetical protein